MEASTIDLKSLGLTPDRLQSLVVARAADTLLDEDEDGEGVFFGRIRTEVNNRIDGIIKAQIDAAVAKIIEERLGEGLEEYIAALTFQATNTWGEPKGERLTFREYLLDRAEKYLSEQVDYDGKGKAEGGYNWSGKRARIEHWVYSHLHNRIDEAVKAVVGDAHKILKQSIEDTVKARLADISKSLKVEVKP